MLKEKAASCSTERTDLWNFSVLSTSKLVGGLGTLHQVYLPLYFVKMGGSPTAIGIALMIASMLACPSKLIGGILADLCGRRPVLVASGLFGAALLPLYALSEDSSFLTMLCALSGLTAASTPAFSALLADSLSPRKRATGIAAATSLSLTPHALAPLVGGVFIHALGIERGFKLACISGLPLALTSASVLAFVKEHRMERTYPHVVGAASSGNGLGGSVSWLLLTRYIIAFANAAVGPLYILYACNEIGLSELEWGSIVSAQVVASMPLRLLGGMVSDRYGRKRIMVFSALACSPCAIAFTLCRSYAEVMLVMILLIAMGVYYGHACEALLADLVPALMRGKAYGIADLGISLASGSGALIGSVLYEHFHPVAPFVLFTSLELASAIAMVAFIGESEHFEKSHRGTRDAAC